jgi:hypothetical protein
MNLSTKKERSVWRYSADEYRAILDAYHSILSRQGGPWFALQKRRAQSRGKPTFLSDKELAWFGKQAARSPSVAAPKPKRGRPKGSELPDEELVAEGLRMVAENRATSIHDAANKLAPKAVGNSRNAKVDRLRRKMMKAKNAALEKK